MERRGKGGGVLSLGTSSLWKEPRQNASNNENGDEFFKRHDAEGKFRCLNGCKTCTCQLKVTALSKFKDQTDPVEAFIRNNSSQVETEKFFWLMEHLLPPNAAKFKGCELIFPDTAFFERGECKCLIKNDSDFCLTAIRAPTKLTIISLCTTFQAINRERRSDQNGVFSQLYSKNFQVQAITKLQSVNNKQLQKSQSVIQRAQSSQSGQRATFVQQNSTIGITDPKGSARTGIGKDSAMVDQKQMRHAPSAVIIRKDDIADAEGRPGKHNMELLTDHAFSRAFDASSTSQQAVKLYQSVQTCLKSQRGIGEPTIVKFYAPMNTQEPDQRIHYDYRSLGADVELIQNDPFKYCVKQCYKMAYYIQKLYQIEILRMQCEFMKDDNKTIWFTFADQIVFRRVPEKEEDQQATKQVSYIDKENQKKLMRILEEHRARQMKKGSKNISKMLNIMSSKYDSLKQQMGLVEALAESSEEEKDEYIQMIEDQKKDFRRKMRQKRRELKQMLINKAMNPASLRQSYAKSVRAESQKGQARPFFNSQNQQAREMQYENDEGVTYGLGISQDKLTRVSMMKRDLSGAQTPNDTSSEMRPNSAATNCFGPKKNKHLIKARSQLSTAASHARFSHVSQPPSRGILVKQFTSQQQIHCDYKRWAPEEMLGLQLSNEGYPSNKQQRKPQQFQSHAHFQPAQALSEHHNMQASTARFQQATPTSLRRPVTQQDFKKPLRGSHPTGRFFQPKTAGWFNSAKPVGGLNNFSSAQIAQSNKTKTMMQEDDDEMVMCENELMLDQSVVVKNFSEAKFRVGQHTKDMVAKIFKAVDKDDQQEIDSLFKKVEKRAQDMCTSAGPFIDMPDFPKSPEAASNQALKNLKDIVHEKNKKRDKGSKKVSEELSQTVMSRLQNDDTQLSKADSSAHNIYQVSFD